MNSFSDSFITVKREYLIDNALYFKEKSKKKLIGVIKSNAYGHGLFEVASTLKSVCEAFAVASLDEAIYLRDSYVNIPILVLNEVNPKYIGFAISYKVMVTVTDLDYLYQINPLIPDDKILQVHIKIDSGMNRLGIKTKEQYIKILDYIKNNPKMEAVGIYTHFHTPNNLDYGNQQIKIFKEIYKAVDHNYEYIHLASSNAVINDLDFSESTHVRIGLGLYGLCDDPSVKPALSFYSRITSIKEVSSGETVGYNANYRANENIYVGIVPVGYSDSILRANGGRYVYVDGHYCEIIGSICMNSLIIKLPKKDIKKEVELIGPHITTREVASHINTIPYEVVTSLSKDLKRVIIP